MSYDLPKVYAPIPKAFRNGMGELFQVTEFNPRKRSEHEKTISAMFGTKDMSIFRPLKELMGMIDVVQNAKDLPRKDIVMSLFKHLEVPYNTLKVHGMHKFIDYVNTHFIKTDTHEERSSNSNTTKN